MAEKNKSAGVSFDLEAARKMAESFAGACGVSCRVCDARGEQLLMAGERGTDCGFCKHFRQCADENCQQLHYHNALQAQRFGGRYIYVCSAGLAFFTAAIVNGGKYAGALTGGPVLLTDVEDFLEGDYFQIQTMDSAAVSRLRMALLQIPETEPRRLEHMSRQLFANAVYVGDSSHEQFLAQKQHERQNAISDYIHRLKDVGEKVSYPADKETALFQAISRGDKAAASNLLNEILGYIFFYTDSDETIRTRITELLVVLSRAAISGGANADRILQLSRQYMQQLRRLNGQEELTRWLAGSLNRFTTLVFDLLDVKHRSAMHSAIDYIKENCTRKITLEEVARHSGYSPSYFSRIFADEIGMNFKEYVNQLRVERSKSLLLSQDLTILEVSSMVGFSDQSYFCKIFKRSAGVSPDVFRKRVRRVDADRAYGYK